MGKEVWNWEFKLTLTLIVTPPKQHPWHLPHCFPLGPGSPCAEDLQEILPQLRIREGPKRSLSPKAGPDTGPKMLVVMSYIR